MPSPARHEHPAAGKPDQDLSPGRADRCAPSPILPEHGHSAGPPRPLCLGDPPLTVFDLLGDGTPISHQVVAAGLCGRAGARANFTLSPDGRWLVFLDPSETVGLWPVETPQPPVTVTVPGLRNLTTLPTSGRPERTFSSTAVPSPSLDCESRDRRRPDDG